MTGRTDARTQPLLLHVASIPVAKPEEGLRRGHRVVWLAGDGQFALQRRHHCRDDRGRFAPCGRWCPLWDDLHTSPNATPINHAIADRDLTRSAT